MLKKTDSWHELPPRLPWEIGGRREAKTLDEAMCLEDTIWEDTLGEIRIVSRVIVITELDGLDNIYVIHNSSEGYYYTILASFEKWRSEATRIY